MLDEYNTLKKRKWGKKTNWYWGKYDGKEGTNSGFVSQQTSMFDLIASPESIKKQENLWSCKMCDKDVMFHEQMGEIPRIGYCEGFTDRKWATQLANSSKEAKAPGVSRQ